MIFGKWGADISVLTALVISIITVLKYFTDRKKSRELETPVFIIEKIESFEKGKFTLLIRNINDNYFVIKNVQSNNKNATCKYSGVCEIHEKSNDDKQIYKGHTLEININSPEEFVVAFDITGITISNRKFIVRTPEKRFSNYIKRTMSIQDRYLEFIKK